MSRVKPCYAFLGDVFDLCSLSVCTAAPYVRVKTDPRGGGTRVPRPSPVCLEAPGEPLSILVTLFHVMRCVCSSRWTGCFRYLASAVFLKLCYLQMTNCAIKMVLRGSKLAERG